MFREYFKVRRLSRQLGMPIATVRMMLAIESGRIDGDVQDVYPVLDAPRPSRRPLLDRLGFLGLNDRGSRTRPGPATPIAAPGIPESDHHC